METGKLYITVLLFVKKGEEKDSHLYEDNVLPILKKYNGELLYRLRPGADSFIDNTEEKPYEVHLISFKTKQDFESYKLDEQRLSFSSLLRSSVSKVIVIEGSKQ